MRKWFQVKIGRLSGFLTVSVSRFNTSVTDYDPYARRRIWVYCLKKK